jgi:hypothetical protein
MDKLKIGMIATVISTIIFTGTAIQSAEAQNRRGHQQKQRVLGNDHGDGAAIIAGILGGLMLGSILSDTNKNRAVPYNRQNEYMRNYSRQQYRYMGNGQTCYDNWVTRYDRAGRQVIINNPVCNTLGRGRR